MSMYESNGRGRALLKNGKRPRERNLAAGPVCERVHMLEEQFWSNRLFLMRKAVQKSPSPAREVHWDHGSDKQDIETLGSIIFIS